MNIKLAVPANKLNYPLYQKISDDNNLDYIKVFPVTEPDNYSLLFRKQVDAALISPLNYAQALKTTDLRIIPASCIAAVGFTGMASLVINNDVADIKKLAIQNPKNFLHLLSPFILKEKFGFNFNIENFSQETLQNKTTDAFIIEGTAGAERISLDITEEWFDLYEMPLTLYFWACWADAYPENITEYINSISTIDEQEENIIEQASVNSSNYEPRQGSVIWRWSEDVKSSLEATLQFMYYHQIINDIPEIKLLGLD